MVSFPSLQLCGDGFGVMFESFWTSKFPETHLLKNRGIRRPSEREACVVPPKFGLPPCWRGMVMVGFIDG